MKQSTSKVIGTDFTTGPILPHLLRFFLPFLLANMLNSLYNTVDTIIIGQFVGSSGIVSVNMGGKMLVLFTNIGIAFTGGGQVLIAQMVGAKQRDKLNSTIGTLFTEMMVLSVVSAAALLLLSTNILTWLNTPAESFADALAYLRITCAGLPLIFGYNAVSAVLRGMGDSKSPLIFIAIATTFNLIGDLIFVVCFQMGAAGTAIATVMGQGLSLICSLTSLYRRRDRFGFDFQLQSFAIDKGKLRVMTKIGFPMALRGFCITITQLVLLGGVNLYGTAEAAAYSIGDKVYHLSNMFVTSVAQGAGGMIGQNIGANRPDRVKSIIRQTLSISMSAAFVLGILSIIFAEAIFGLFTTDPEVLAYAGSFMRICFLIYIMCSLMATYESIISATGHSTLSFIGGLLDGVVFRVCFSYLFAHTLNMGVVGYFMGEALARLGPILVSTIYYYSGAWLRRKKLIDES